MVSIEGFVVSVGLPANTVEEAPSAGEASSKGVRDSWPMEAMFLRVC